MWPKAKRKIANFRLAFAYPGVIFGESEANHRAGVRGELESVVRVGAWALVMLHGLPRRSIVRRAVLTTVATAAAMRVLELAGVTVVHGGGE